MRTRVKIVTLFAVFCTGWLGALLGSFYFRKRDRRMAWFCLVVGCSGYTFGQFSKSASRMGGSPPPFWAIPLLMVTSLLVNIFIFGFIFCLATAAGRFGAWLRRKQASMGGVDKR